MLHAIAVTLFPFLTLHAAGHAARTLLVALADYTVRATLVFAAAWIVTALLRRRAAATRYAVWTVAVAMVAVLPLLARVTPPLVVSLPAVAPTPTLAARQAVPLAARSAAHVVTQGPLSAGRPEGHPYTSLRAPSETIPSTAKGKDSPAHSRPISIDLPLAAVLIWLAGAFGLFVRFVVGTVVVWRRAAVAEHLMDAGWVMLAREVAGELSIRRPVTLLMTRTPIVPVTWGIVYPVVLLPRDALAWPSARRRIVLLHELAHVARFDAATQLVGQIVLAANWFNPLAWVAISRMRADREGACDDVVLTRGTRASSYAEDLLGLVRALRPSTTSGFAALAMVRHTELEGRLRCILDGRRRRARSSARALVFSFVTAAPFVLLVAAVRPLRRLPQPTANESPSPVVAHMAAIVRSVTRAALPSPRLTVAFPALPVPVLQVPVLQAPVFQAPTLRVSADQVPAMQASALLLPSSPASYRCPVVADFVHGGVSADGGKPGALEAEHGDRRILVFAEDGRCVTGRIDGRVALDVDATDVVGLGAGGQLSVTDVTGGHTRRAAVTLQDAGSDVGNYTNGQHARGVEGVIVDNGQPLYVVDGKIVDNGGSADDTQRLWVIQQNNINQTLVASGGAQRTNPDDIEHVPASSGNSHRVIEFRYFVDGQPRPWDEGRDWFHTTLAELVRETAYDARDRVIELRLRGGVPAVLDEIRHVKSEMGAKSYFEALIDVSGPNPITVRNTNAYGDEERVYAKGCSSEQHVCTRLSADEAKQAADLAQSMLPSSEDRDRIVSRLRAADGSIHPF